MAYRRRRTILVFFISLVVILINFYVNQAKEAVPDRQLKNTVAVAPPDTELAIDTLGKLAVKGRAPKTGYARTQFMDDWAEGSGCDTRNILLRRDLSRVVLDDDQCIVLSGQITDPYTAKIINFQRGFGSSSKVQIDHIVALSDAWQKGAQQLSYEQRNQFANDPLNLLAVDGPANQNKGDGDAATWLPPNKSYRCAYVARQIAVKAKYHLWVTQAEHDAMSRILSNCPHQALPIR